MSKFNTLKGPEKEHWSERPQAQALLPPTHSKGPDWPPQEKDDPQRNLPVVFQNLLLLRGKTSTQRAVEKQVRKAISTV